MMSTDHPPEPRRKPILLRKRFLIPLCVSVVAASFPISTLEVRDVDDERVLFVSSTSRGQTFEIRYIHSVERIPVAGVFRVSQANRIVVEESIFSSYGAGLPFDTPREDITYEGGRMRVRHHGMVMDRLRIFVSPFTEQQFIYGDGRVDLSSVGEGHIVEIRVKRTPLSWYWARRFFDVVRGGFDQSSG
jgi:hypothetical protein